MPAIVRKLLGLIVKNYGALNGNFYYGSQCAVDLINDVNLKIEKGCLNSKIYVLNCSCDLNFEFWDL